MLSDLLGYLLSYKIFDSILFRSGLGYLTVYFMVSLIMPYLIKKFRQNKLGADFSSNPVPIMGGILLIFASLISIFLWSWVWYGPYVLIICFTLVVFGLIGFWDDMSKVLARSKIARGDATKNIRDPEAQKADGISAKLRLFLEFSASFLILGVLFFVFSKVNSQLHIPFLPLSVFFPELPIWVYYIAASFLLVAGTNAVNITDGLDTLASIPLLTSFVFVGLVAYLSGDASWSSRLNIPYLGEEIKEVSVISTIFCGALMSFLKYNSPPASVYLGDIGSLGFGAALTVSFIIIKAEFFLSIVGGIFVISVVSSFLQIAYFKILTRYKGINYAKKNRLFYKAPYHHHLQQVYRPDKDNVTTISHFQNFIKRFKIFSYSSLIDGPKNLTEINNKIIWHSLLKAIWLLVIAILAFIKFR